LLKAFSWLFTATAARQLAFFIVNLVLFERLSRPVFGDLALAFSYVVVFVSLGEFGVRHIGWRTIARYPDEAGMWAGKFLAAKSVPVAVATVVYLLAMPLLWKSGSVDAVYLLYALGIPFNAATFDYALLGLDRMDLFARYSFVAFSLYLLGTVILVTRDERAWLVPVLFVACMIVAFAAELRWLTSNYRGFSLSLRYAEFREIIAESWPIGIGETVNRLNLSYPLILIGAVVGSTGVGNYRIAELAYAFLAQCGYLLAATGFSRLSHEFEHRRDSVRATLRRMLLVSGIGALVAGPLLTIAGPYVLPLVVASVEQETLAVLGVLGIALVFAAPARLLRGVLASIDRQRALVVINSATLVVGATLGWAATVSYGITGMAVAVAITEALSLIVLTATCLWGLPGR